MYMYVQQPLRPEHHLCDLDRSGSCGGEGGETGEERVGVKSDRGERGCGGRGRAPKLRMDFQRGRK